MARKNQISPIVCYTLLIIASIFSIFPVFWMVSVSFRTNVEIYKIPVSWLPPAISTEAYDAIWKTPLYIRIFANSYFVSAAVTVVSLVLAVLAGYSFSRFDFRGSRIFQMLIIGTQMIPPRLSKRGTCER